MTTDSAVLPGALPGRLAANVAAAIPVLERIPHSLIALLGRCSIAAVFWSSGQTKVEGFAVDLVGGTVELGWPRLADSAVALFRDEYRLPLVSPELAAYGAAVAEHLLPVLLLIGLGTRFAALALLGHDRGHPVPGLSGRLAAPRHLGDHPALPGGDRARAALPRPLDQGMGHGTRRRSGVTTRPLGRR